MTFFKDMCAVIRRVNHRFHTMIASLYVHWCTLESAQSTC